ncbi:MAG TPA: Asp-tRNA(Asn)/Glu-tRNA(Gln) amidotransferase subunit GatB, partial [Candidatus Dojkabacteria bacterium]
MKYEAVIGLEVHLQTKTKSKMFCSCSSEYFNEEPNTHVCPVCLGLPGALPVPNKKAIEECIKLAIALNCDINKESKFDRKNYFYPDLPKAYQISQYDQPIGEKGFVEVDIEGDSRRIRITRVHQEEDTGKSIHTETETLLDFNKSGMALIEIVSEPDMTSKEEVLAFAKRLRQIVRYLGTSNADMEKGQMRFEVNMSLRPMGEKSLPNYKVEVKNIGSISVLEKVIESEFERQSYILESGEIPEQETRGLKDMSGTTVSQRKKEGEADYRYFPEPDIPPMVFEESYLSELKKQIPELPQEKKRRYVGDLGLEDDSAEIIVASKKRYKFFEEAIEGIEDKKIIKEIAKWLIGDYASLSKLGKYKSENVTSENLRNLVEILLSGTITGKAAKQIIEEMFKSGNSPEMIIKEKGLEVMQDTGAIEEAVDKVIAENQKVVQDLTKNPNAIGFLVGHVMRETKGKADPATVNKLLKEK